MNRKPFPFEKLDVWQDARVLVKGVYNHTKSFPKSEMFGLVSQLNRAAVSVASNLAEGSVRGSLKDQAHFSNLAYGSLMEGACQIILSSDLGFISPENADHLLANMQDLSIRIHNLRESQLRRASAG
jgi:four helix bundle protein